MLMNYIIFVRTPMIEILDPPPVSRTNLLPLPATNLYYIDIHRCHQADSSTTMSNALRDMYLLSTALRGYAACEVDQISIHDKGLV